MMIRLILVCILLILAVYGGAFLYQWVCTKLGIDPAPANQSPATPVAGTYSLYQQYRCDYEHFSYLFMESVRGIAGEYDLKTPTAVSDVLAGELADRIGLNNGRVVFRFEVESKPRPILMEGGAKVVPQKKRDLTALRLTVIRNLRMSMRDGYLFTGPVYVSEVPGSKIRVEIHGVSRVVPNGMEDILL